MAGDYDALLEWPFCLPIKLELLNQTQGLKRENYDDAAKNVVHTIVPKVIPENEPFLGKPTDKNRHFGIQKFVPVAEMKEGGRYVKKDIAYLAVTVDVSAVKEPFYLTS
ncbi:TNF receptor-associated factor 3 [Aphelenchoides avenae]|nr:TNF receptor-associated factor 3 [Aphelenchus avenae]